MTTAITTLHTLAAGLDSVQIVSVPPVKVEDGKKLVSWSRRSTTANPVTATERFRGVLVSEAALRLPDGATTSKFERLLQSTIDSLADAKFQDYIKDRMLETSMPAAVLTIDSVMAYWAEERQRQTIDGAKISDWLKTSATAAALTPAQSKAWQSKLPKLAAPSYRLNFSKTQAAAIVSKLADADLENPVCIFIATRCNNILTDESVEESL